jgi:hypothetical protein
MAYKKKEVFYGKKISHFNKMILEGQKKPAKNQNSLNKKTRTEFLFGIRQTPAYISFFYSKNTLISILTKI